MSRFIVLVVFVVAVMGIGFLIGTAFPTGEWYASLEKPSWTPPSEVFVWVWPVLYFLIAVAGWSVFVNAQTGWGLWLANLVFNFLYTPVFFGLHLVGWSVLVVGATLVTAIAFTSATWHRNRLASVCFIPYTLWLGYAFTLSLAIWWANA